MSRAAVPSVRRRLLVNLLVGFVLCWLSVAALTYHLSLKQVNRLFDDDMVDFGEAALRLLDLATEDQAGEDGSITEIIERSREAIQGLPLLRRESALGYALWRDGQPLLSSLNLPPEITAQGPGFSTVEAQGTHWRVLQLNIDGFQIWISENLIYRQHTMNLLLFYSLFPLLLALPLLGGLVWFGVARGLAPLREVQAEVQQRSARHLQPIAVEAVPLEIRGLIDELNLLLERLRTALEAERRLTSDAAHEIRTPLASLRTHAQVALRSEDPKAHARGLLQVSRSVERISTLMEQILLLARLDGDALLEQFHPVNLATLAEDVLSELARQAIDKDIELSLHQETVHVMGIDLWLKAMVGNLVGNALRYTPAGGQVEIRVENRAQHAVLRVRDNGPGSPWKSSRRSSPASTAAPPPAAARAAAWACRSSSASSNCTSAVSAWARDWRARAGSAGVPAEDPAGRDAAAGQKVRTAGGHISDSLRIGRERDRLAASQPPRRPG